MVSLIISLNRNDGAPPIPTPAPPIPPSIPSAPTPIPISPFSSLNSQPRCELGPVSNEQGANLSFVIALVDMMTVVFLMLITNDDIND